MEEPHAHCSGDHDHSSPHVHAHIGRRFRLAAAINSGMLAAMSGLLVLAGAPPTMAVDVLHTTIDATSTWATLWAQEEGDHRALKVAAVALATSAVYGASTLAGIGYDLYLFFSPEKVNFLLSTLGIGIGIAGNSAILLFCTDTIRWPIWMRSLPRFGSRSEVREIESHREHGHDKTLGQVFLNSHALGDFALSLVALGVTGITFALSHSVGPAIKPLLDALRIQPYSVANGLDIGVSSLANYAIATRLALPLAKASWGQLKHELVRVTGEPSILKAIVRFVMPCSRQLIDLGGKSVSAIAAPLSAVLAPLPVPALSYDTQVMHASYVSYQTQISAPAFVNQLQRAMAGIGNYLCEALATPTNSEVGLMAPPPARTTPATRPSLQQQQTPATMTTSSINDPQSWDRKGFWVSSPDTWSRLAEMRPEQLGGVQLGPAKLSLRPWPKTRLLDPLQRQPPGMEGSYVEGGQLWLSNDVLRDDLGF
jgi:hypothetical protein